MDTESGSTKHRSKTENASSTWLSQWTRLRTHLAQRKVLRRWDLIAWTPRKCRWNSDNPPKFHLGLNILFGFACAFTVANLYYSPPILNILARDFGVSYGKVAQIPTLAQAGYAVGLLFICPLGDLLPRRPFVLILIFFTATLSIGLCVAKSIVAFSAIQFIVAVTTVTPQLLMPLVGELAPPNRRATALSIVASGVMLGVLLARLLAGIITTYTSWRYVYWLSVGCQYVILILLWLFMPDYPSSNPQGLNYFSMLWSMPVMLTKHPVLVQACIITFFTFGAYTSFWTVLTFLLSGPPFHYDPLIVGLFALVGIGSLVCGPVYSRYVTDRFVPLFTVLTGLCFCLAGICIGTFTGTFTIAGPIIQAFVMDLGVQVTQIANRAEILPIEPKGRNRVNTTFMVFTFCGQLAGTSIGIRLYTRAGWVASGSYCIAGIGVALIAALARGPRETGWVGWHGGWNIRKSTERPASRDEVKGNLQQLGTDVTRGQDKGTFEDC